MPTLANVTINDGAATPVARTFNPGPRDDNGFQSWYEKTASAAIGFWKLMQRLKFPVAGAKVSDASRVYRHEIQINTPVLEVSSPSTGTGIQPAPTIAYGPSVRVEFVLPERSTSQDRKHLRLLLANYLAHANTVAAVDNLEPVYNG